MNQEMRTFESSDLELRGAPGAGAVLSGYSYKFNRQSQMLGWFFEQVLPGFGVDSMAADNIKFTYNHGTLMARSIPELQHFTLRTAEDEIGGRFEADIPDTQCARDVWTLVERGDITGTSFMFRTLGEDETWWSETQDGIPLRSLKRGKLFDESVVDDPAYLDTEVQATGTMRCLAMNLRRPLAEVRSAFEARDLSGIWTPVSTDEPTARSAEEGSGHDEESAPGYRDLMRARLELLDIGIPIDSI